MKVITQDLVSGTPTQSAGNTLAVSYGLDAMLDNFPRHAFISTSASTTVSINCKAGVNAALVNAYKGDTINYTFKDSGGSTIQTGSLATSYISTYETSTLRSNINVRSYWLDLPYQSGTSSLELAITVSTDRKDDPIKGNSIGKWNQTATNSTTGRFEDSSDAGINLKNHGRIHIGSIVTFADNSTAQIVRVTGDGSLQGSVTLNNNPADQNISKITDPVSIGIMRIGKALEFENSQIGLKKKLTDYSFKRPLKNGAYVFDSRRMGRIFSGKFITTKAANEEEFTEFAINNLGSPFACNLLDDMGLAYKLSLFGYFEQEPAISYDDKTATMRTVSFSIREVV